MSAVDSPGTTGTFGATAPGDTAPGDTAPGLQSAGSGGSPTAFGSYGPAADITQPGGSAGSLPSLAYGSYGPAADISQPGGNSGSPPFTEYGLFIGIMLLY